MSKKSELLKQLETLPQFQALKKGIIENLRDGGDYLNGLYPDSVQGERDIDGKLRTWDISEDKQYEIALDEFFNSIPTEGLRNDLVHETLFYEVTDFVIALAKEILK